MYLLCVRLTFDAGAHTVRDSQYAMYPTGAELRQASVTQMWRFYVFEQSSSF